MNELLCDDLWPTIRKLAHRAAVRRAAVAYVTSDEILRFTGGDVLVTDASDHAIAAGHTSARLLQNALARKVKLYSLPGLHAKVMVLGDTAVIGSANISNSSARDLVEAAWVTNASGAVGMAVALIAKLTGEAVPIDARFLERISKIDVKPPPPGSRRPTGARPINVPEHRTWIVSVREMSREPAGESEAIESGMAKAREKLGDEASEASWMRWTNNSRFRKEAAVGDTVIRIWTRAGTVRPLVYRHAPIVCRQDEERCTRFFVEDFSDCEDTYVSMTKFLELLTSAGFTGKLGVSPTREIPNRLARYLEELWT